MIEFLSQLIVFNYKVMCTIKYIGNSIWDGTGRTGRTGRTEVDIEVRVRVPRT